MRLLRAADPLRHRRFGNQERVGDLGGRQAADRAQRERDRRRTRQRGMTAHEQQDRACRPGPFASALPARSRLARRHSDRAGDVPGRIRRHDGFAPPPGAARCGGDRSCAARRPGSASRAGCRARPPSATAAAAASSASCTASSAAEKSPKRRTTAPRTCGASSRSRFSPVNSGDRASHLDGRRAHHLAHLDRHVERRAARAGRRRRSRRNLVRALRALDVHDPVAGEELLGLGKGAVGDLGRAALARRARSWPAPATQAPRRRPARRTRSAPCRSVFMKPMCALRSSGAHFEIPPVPVPARRIHHQHELHVAAPLSRLLGVFRGKSEPIARSRHPDDEPAEQF